MSPPSDKSSPSDKSPLSTVCAGSTGSFIDPACLGRPSEINGFMPQGRSGQRVPDIDSPEIPSRGQDGPDEPTQERDDYLVSPVVGIDTL